MFKFNTHIVNFCLIFMLFGCMSSIETRGYIPENDKIKAIKPEVSTKDKVIAILGYPSSVTTFDNNKWLYIESSFEKSAFFDAEEVATQVLEITFTNDDKVKTINHYELLDGSEVTFSKDTTPTYGHSVNAVQQMIGNIGRFNKPTN